MLDSDRIEFLMEAHNGLSARIVEEAGHRGIWASGLAISASMGVRDNNEASWTQVLEILEFMSDATSVPIMLDGDTGYGNFNNVRRLVRKLEQRNIAAVCLEDKLFPKANSFIDGDRQALAPIDEFAGKIKAARDAAEDDDFCVVARIEAFIAGWGLAEMLKRAEAYHAAGADAVLVHSKLTTPTEILSFMAEWDKRCPVVVVPTTYYSTPTEVFEEADISMVIWANHILRSGIAAMQRTAKQLFEQQSLLTIEDNVVTVPEVFRLQGAGELKEAESRYLPQSQSQRRAIVLAASRGKELGRLTDDKPKTMLAVRGEPLLATLVRNFNESGIGNVSVVVGYKPESVTVPGIRKVLNEAHADTKELYSLYLARDSLDAATVVSFGDVIFKRYILLDLLNQQGDIVIAVDGRVEADRTSRRYTDLVRCSEPYTRKYLDEAVWVEQMSPDLAPTEAHGEWIGLMSMTVNGAQMVLEALDTLHERDDFRQLRMKDLFAHLIDTGKRVQVVYVSGHWLDVDDVQAISDAIDF